MTNLEHCISLVVGKELEKNFIRAWYRSISDTIATGVTRSIVVDGREVRLVKSKDQDGVRYSIPLTRDLTADEVSRVIADFSHDCAIDFKITATTSPLDVEAKTEVEVEHAPMIALCTKWAREKHENWCKRKEDAGWRYGPTVCRSSRTHPLLRAWEEIPSEYRKVDTTAAQELLDLLHDSGYVLIRSDDLDRLMGE